MFHLTGDMFPSMEHVAIKGVLTNYVLNVGHVSQEIYYGETNLLHFREYHTNTKFDLRSVYPCTKSHYLLLLLQGCSSSFCRHSILFSTNTISSVETITMKYVLFKIYESGIC